MRTVFVLILFFHGVIHLIGFLKSFQVVKIPQLSQAISTPWGFVWLLVTLMFLAAGVFFLLKHNLWLWLSMAALIVSQLLIFMNWQDAKFGTLVNLVILTIVIVGVADLIFENKYRNDVSESFKSQNISEAIIKEKDLENLPIPVQNYLKYVGILGKPKVMNAKVIFKGEMREKGRGWFDFTSEQYNFFEDPGRLFFMKAIFKGLPTTGYHRYKASEASMSIKLLSLFSVVNIKGQELFTTETVTFFNDLCLFAPAALIDKNIQWQAIDSVSAKAFFTNRGVTIAATLYFNEKGQLVNFVSEDRIDVKTHGKIPFSTPIKKYGNINGYNLPVTADAVWHFPEGDFVYGKFYLQNIVYNLTELE